MVGAKFNVTTIFVGFYFRIIKFVFEFSVSILLCHNLVSSIMGVDVFCWNDEFL